MGSNCSRERLTWVLSATIVNEGRGYGAWTVRVLPEIAMMMQDDGKLQQQLRTSIKRRLLISIDR